MDFINKIELQGMVGAVKIIPVNESKVARFSLATNYTNNSKGGTIIIDTTRFSCTAWQGDKITNIDSLQKGSIVHIIGRVRMQNYIDSTGQERQSWEIVVSELNIL